MTTNDLLNRGARALLPLVGLLACGGAAATVRTDAKPDLLFVLWDANADAAFTLDLGIAADDFWRFAQTDAGYTWQYTLPASDPRLTAFRAASTNVANQRWGVVAVSSNRDASDPGVNRVYTTLRQGPGNNVVNPNWLDMTTYASSEFLFATQRNGTRWYRDLNSWGGADNQAMNTHPSSDNGSAFHTASSPRYFGNNQTFYAQVNPGAEGSSYAGIFDITNEVNKSSWFYYLTNAAGNTGAVVADEFDNLNYNGFWGLALTSTNTYLLSYTLTAASVPKNASSTSVGELRLATTDYRASLGEARLIGVESSVSAVSEPGSALLLGLGLGGLGLARRKHRAGRPDTVGREGVAV